MGATGTAKRPALRERGEKRLFRSASQLGALLHKRGLSKEEAAYQSALALHFTMRKNARCLALPVDVRQVASHEATVERLRQRRETLIPVSCRSWRYNGAYASLLFTCKEKERHEVGYVCCTWVRMLLREGYMAYLDVSGETRLVISFKSPATN